MLTLPCDIADNKRLDEWVAPDRLLEDSIETAPSSKTASAVDEKVRARR